MKITFRGAVRTVTGSQHQIDIAGKTYLLDCGLFQGPRALARQINSTFAFDPKTITAVILSHAHADHVGNLPNLVKQGFAGPIYCTKATAAISALMLLDSAKIQEEDAGYLNQKTNKSWQGDIQPLYTVMDAQETIKRFTFSEYRQVTDLGDFTFEFRDAGHVLGSAAVRLVEKSSGRRLVFTGDVGRPHSALLQDPDRFDAADAIISECTYGGKTHPPTDAMPQLLADSINRAVARNGTVIMPAFALGRTQSLVFLLHQLREQNKIPQTLHFYIDAPLASKLTEVFRQYTSLMDEETRAVVSPFDFPNLTYIKTVDESKALNSARGPMVIIAGSGMCESGRVLHHLKHHLADPHTLVILPGYQGEATLGRKLQDGLKTVPILGDMIPVRAEIIQMGGLSAHADEGELLSYVAPIKPAKTYLVHVEMPSALAHQDALQKAGWPSVVIPDKGDSVEV